ncbi:hypothetical protein GBAR_LOCUS8911 [Geodia barretti]|uniref:Uncharacterized protein n=1 Tax=Geodia barretti TaxID=519541 RepID=A0AA35WBA0_GEOBA|nr:hypothetical protein GBAR_LOCUS8911 [Geodia barretti]
MLVQRVSCQLEMEHRNRLFAAATLLLLSLESGALLLATPRDESRVLNSDGRRQTTSDCPSYFPGVSPNSRPLVGCRTGPAIGNVDHVQAFGFEGSNVDLRSCDLPEYPETK